MENKLKQIIEDVTHSVLMEQLLVEYGMKTSKYSDKYGEVIGSVVDNLICILIYPDNSTIPHWRGRSIGLCKRFAEINIDPVKKNTFKIRFKCLKDAVEEVLDKDFKAIYNHFKSVIAYYSNKTNKFDVIYPYSDLNTCYEDNKGKIIDAVMTLTNYVAEQDYDSMITYINNFK